MFALFVIFLTLLMGSVHFFLWYHLVYQVTSPGPARIIGTIIMVILTLLVVLPFALGRSYGLSVLSPIAWTSYLYMGFMFFVIVLLSISDLISLIGHLANIQFFITNAAWPIIRATAVLIGALLMTVIGTVKGLGTPVITKYEVKIPNLPENFDGFTIAHLSDLHISALLQHEWLARRVSETNALKPDLIAITGDLTDGQVQAVSRELEPLKDLQAPYGTYFVSGNHEYISDIEGWLAYLPQTGLKVLQNSHDIIEKEGQSIYLAGVNDLVSGNSSFKRATMGIPAAATIIGLAHQPNAAKEAKDYEIALLLSGHTHGGQMWPFNYVVDLAQPWVKGWYQIDKMQLIVSQGTGSWGPPMRLGSQGEILLITLHK